MRFTVRAKLGAAFGAVVLLSMVAGGVAYIKLAGLNETVDEIANVEAKRMETAEEMKAHLLLVLRAEKNAILASTDEDTAQYVQEVGKELDQTKSTLDQV